MVIYICEDNKSDEIRLQHYLASYASKHAYHFTVQSFSSSIAMLDAYKSTKKKQPKRLPALIFLDIYMNELTGIEAAEQLLQLECTSGIIFTTSSVKFAIDSYRIGALYYLHKPYTNEDFELAMERCQDILRFSALSIPIHTKTADFSIPYEQVSYLESLNHRTYVHTLQDVYMTAQPLSTFADDLCSSSLFIRCGRSYLINLQHIVSFTDTTLTMDNDKEVFIPVRLRKEIYNLIQNYKFSNN